MGDVGGDQGHRLPADDGLVGALANAAPGDAPSGQFPHRLGGHMGEDARNLLVAAPVAAADRICEVHILVVALALDAVGQTCLHATLGGHRVGALGGDQG